MKKMKKIFALLLAVAMVLGMSTTAFAETTIPTAADKTIATVTNVEANATVTAYQIVKGSYNTNGFVEYVKANNSLVIADVTAPTSTEVTTIASMIADNGISLSSKSMSASEGAPTTYTAELEAGYWIVLVKGVSEVYNPMLVGVYYSVGGSDNTLTNESVSADDSWQLVTQGAYAKSTPTNITKNANGTTWNLGDTVKYTVTVTVPQYSAAYDAEDIEFKVVDQAVAEELSIKTETIKVQVDDKDIDESNYELTASASTYTVDFAGGWVQNNAGKTITITYDATIIGAVYANDTGDNLSHDNIVTLTYTNAAEATDTDVKTDTAKESIFTFKIENMILKTGEDGDDEGTEPDALPGATFTIYKDAECTEVYTNSVHTEGTVVSGTNGYVNIYGVDLGTYYIKETIAPLGYSLNNTVYKVVVSATETRVESDSDTVADITITASENGKEATANTVLNIPNTKISTLPSTGGIGTTIFTIGGCAIMIAAAFFFFVSRRKEA